MHLSLICYQTIKEKESFNQQVYFEYDVRRHFGLIYFVSTSQVNKPVKLEKNKPVKLEKVLAELKKRGQKPIEYKVAPGAKVIEKK